MVAQSSATLYTAKPCLVEPQAGLTGNIGQDEPGRLSMPLLDNPPFLIGGAWIFRSGSEPDSYDAAIGNLNSAASGGFTRLTAI